MPASARVADVCGARCQHMRFALIIRALPVPGRCVPMYVFVPPLRYNDPDVHGA